MGRGKQRTRGVSEPGEYSKSSSRQVCNTGSGKAEVISPLVLHYISAAQDPVGADNCAYQEAPERENKREKESAGVSVKGLRGTKRQ